MKRNQLLYAALLAPLMTVVGCGGGGSSDATTESAATSVSTPSAQPDAKAAAAGHVAPTLAPTARLTTPWTAAALQAPVPLPEYPRPQLTRTDWLNLNGKWSYNGGSAAPNAENPPDTAPSFPNNAEQVLVPYPVESYLSGIQRMNERSLWYKRNFSLPTTWSGKRVKLNFGAVDRKATVYVNGQQVGQHSGGYDAFSFDITAYLRAGNNELVVGAFDPTDGQDTVGKQSTTPGGIWYTPTSGIWQTVWLEPVAAPHITRLDMTPDLVKNTIRVIPRGDGITAGQAVTVSVYNGTSFVGTASGAVNQELSIAVPNPRLWSPSDPFLYDVKATIVKGDQTLDTVGSYFGMRSISVGTVDGVPRPLLNGKFVFQHGPLDQGFWPDGLYTAPTDDALKSDLQAIKDLGFNMLRKHIKVEPQRWFYWADKLGVLVWQDMPHAWDAESDPVVRARVEAEDREIVDEHRSSPAVITWVIFNESWGDFDMVRMANTFKAWDPSRLVNTHSGINFAPGDQGTGDLIDNHDYPGPSSPRYQPGRVAVLGEYGGNGLRTDGHMWNPSSTCCYTLYPDSATLTQTFLGQINGLRELAISNGLSAAVYTEITDVEDELNGFLTYDRQVKKMDFAAVRSANQALIDGVPVLRLGAPYSFRTVTPNLTDRYLGHVMNTGLIQPVTATSSDALKQSTSWKVAQGLADATCVSFESIDQPGKFLRHTSFLLRLEAGDNSDLFRQDATFCPRKALNGGTGVSFESKNYPNYFIRHMGGVLVLNPTMNNDLFRADASWAPVTGWWRSSVALPVGEFRSLRVTTPDYDTRFMRHSNELVNTEAVTANSDDVLKQDATWRIVKGLADPSCYSFESKNFPGEYIRHANSRVRRDPLIADELFRHDATFCTLAGAGGSVRFAAYDFPNRFLRHFNAEVWIADGQGTAWNTTGGLIVDSSWAHRKPLGTVSP